MEQSTNWYVEPFKKFAVFQGRSCRAEYWTFWGVNFVIGFLIGMAGSSADAISVLFILITIVPSLAVCVRRLHDTNRSGLLLLILVIPLAGIFLLVFLGQDSQVGPNRFGSNPKGVNPEDMEQSL